MISKPDLTAKIIQFKGDVAESYRELSVAIKKEFGSASIASKEQSNTIIAAVEVYLRLGELLNNPSQEDLDRMILARDKLNTYQKQHTQRDLF